MRCSREHPSTIAGLRRQAAKGEHTSATYVCMHAATVRPCFLPMGAKRKPSELGLPNKALVDELHRDGLRDDPGVESLVEQSANSGASPLSVVSGPVVDVHPDEGVGL